MSFPKQATCKATEAKRTGSHFTPPRLADFVARKLVTAIPPAMFNQPLEVLDPSCGGGELLRAFIEAVPREDRDTITLIGVEDNTNSLAETRRRLEEDHAKHILLHADFLELSSGFGFSPTFDSLLNGERENGQLHSPLIIIANPPYVRTQVLGSERAQQLASKFKLKGRVDLYQAFLIAMTDVLQENGFLGVITSNRFLTTKSGQTVRAFLNEQYDLLEVIDLGDTKLFSAAVLPAVIIAKKKSARSDSIAPPRFTKIYERLERVAQEPVTALPSVIDAIETGQNGDFAVGAKIFQVSSGPLVVGATANEPWRMISIDEAKWVALVDRHSKVRIADVAKVRVGIKTTADPVYIRDDWDDLPKDIRPESDLLRPIYTHFEANRWRANKPVSQLKRILYTHESSSGKREVIDLAQYPKAKNYLESHRAILEGRKYVIESGRQWYEIWVPQEPAAWLPPKVIFPDISVEPRFFIGEPHALVNGDCYWIALDSGQLDLLYLIQGVANSDVMARYHDLVFNNKLYSGRRRFITQYVERYPLPDPAGTSARTIVELVKKLNDPHCESRHAQLEDELDALVAHALTG